LREVSDLRRAQRPGKTLTPPYFAQLTVDKTAPLIHYRFAIIDTKYHYAILKEGSMKTRHQVQAVTLSTMKRRSFLSALGGIVAAPAVLTASKTFASTQLVIRDPGGPVGAAWKEAYYDPFFKETGIRVVGVASQHEPASQVRAMVDTKNYTWDMAVLTRTAHDLLIRGNYLDPLNIDSDSAVQGIPQEFKTAHLLGVQVFSSTFTYRTDKFPKDGPQNWADVYDAKRFPGRRAFRKHPLDTMEQALMADGVAPANLYPLDIDRAFRKLDTIKSHVNPWWTGGAQASQLIKSGEVDICPTFTNRAQVAINDGAPAKIVWNQGMYQYEGIAILRGTPKAEDCRKFARFCARADRQAASISMSNPLGPTNPAAIPMISASLIPLLPTAPQNKALMRHTDYEYWGREMESVLKRFNEWIIK